MTDAAARPPLRTIATQWGRIGSIGFGGPPTHIALLRQLCVERRQWLTAQEFEDAIAACNLLPGPASTQLAIFSAWRVAGVAGGPGGGAAVLPPRPGVILPPPPPLLPPPPPPPAPRPGAGGGGAAPPPAGGGGRGPRAPP